jgi:ADP-heptose:LPS heptosyltransferase
MIKQALRTLMLWLVRVLGASRASKARNAGQVRRILLVRPDHLGDLVLTTPVLNALKTQACQADITMMTGPWSKIIVERHPALDEVVTCAFPGFRRAAQNPLDPYLLLWRTARELRAGNYDLAINLRPDFWWGAALLYLAGIPRRIGYAIEPGTPFLTHALPFPAQEHATASNLRLISTGLEVSGYPKLAEPLTAECYPLVFTPTSEEQSWARTRLQEEGISEQEPLIVIHPGTGAAVKLWRADGWAWVANQLIAGWHFPQSPRLLLTGSPTERPLLEEIARQLARKPVICADQSVGQLAALLQRAQLVLGVDSGPLHLAVAQDTPSLQIFGPTDMHIFGPWGNPQRHVIITSHQRCPGCTSIPCGRLDFTAEEVASHPCVRLVSDETVLHTVHCLIEAQIAHGGRSHQSS